MTKAQGGGPIAGEPTVGSLFSGIGGLDLAFGRARVAVFVVLRFCVGALRARALLSYAHMD